MTRAPFHVSLPIGPHSDVLLRATDHGLPRLDQVSVALHEDLYFEAGRGTVLDLLRTAIRHPLTPDLLGRAADVSDLVLESWAASGHPLPFADEVEVVAIWRADEISVTLLRRRYGEITVTLTRSGEALLSISNKSASVWVQGYMTAMILGATHSWVETRSDTTRALQTCAARHLIGLGTSATPETVMLVQYGEHQCTAGLRELIDAQAQADQALMHVNLAAQRRTRQAARLPEQIQVPAER